LPPFLESENETALWLGLMGRDSGTRASRILGIRDEVIALDFDRAITLRLQRHDVEVQRALAKRIAIAAAMTLDGKLSELPEDF
jgi:hypothetical protein